MFSLPSLKAHNGACGSPRSASIYLPLCLSSFVSIGSLFSPLAAETVYRSPLWLRCALLQAEPEPEPAPPVEDAEEEDEEEEGDVVDLPTFSRKDRQMGRGKVIVQSVLESGGGAAYQRQEVAKSAEDLAKIMAAFEEKALFSKLDKDQRTEVAAIMQRQTFAPGEPLCSEGENGDTFFIVVSGTCEVSMGGRFLRQYPQVPGTSEGFGEIALIYNQPRAATVIAKTETEA